MKKLILAVLNFFSKTKNIQLRKESIDVEKFIHLPKCNYDKFICEYPGLVVGGDVFLNGRYHRITNIRNHFEEPHDFGDFDNWNEFCPRKWPRKGDYITVGGVYYVYNIANWIVKPRSSSKSFTSFAYAIDSLRAEKFASAWGYPKGYENCNIEVSIKENGVQQKVKPFLSEVIATVTYSIKGI